MSISVHLDELLAARGMTLSQLANEVGITVVNLSVLECQPGDLLRHRPPS